MSHKTKSIVAIFWSLVDDIFNAALFVVIGLELILIKFSHSLILGGVIAIIASLVARHCSLLCINVAWLVARARQAMKYSLPRLRNQLMQSLVTYPFLMTWGGLRGGISIALALSLPNSFMHKESFLAFTFMVVIFSIVIQGTTFCSLLNLMKNYLKKFPRDH